MTVFFRKVSRLPKQYPVVRGMISYGLIWPCSSLTQEYLVYGTPLTRADWGRAARFGVFGMFFMAPVFYTWLKFSSRFFKQKTLGTAVKRAVIEQVSYGPTALAYFLVGMSVLEGKPLDVCLEELHQKFWSTYKSGMVYWPTVQTLNFYFVPERNRMVFVSLASFLWTVYLAHVKAQDINSEKIDKVGV